MKKILIICIFIFIPFLLSGCTKDNSKNTAKFNTKAMFSKLSTQNNNNNNNLENNLNSENNIKKEEEEPKKIVETEVANFSTPLKSGVAKRITNIKITSGKINEYVLKNGETFSFNQLIGPCTAEEGYKKAEIYVNKQIKYALGGRKLSGKYNII